MLHQEEIAALLKDFYRDIHSLSRSLLLGIHPLLCQKPSLLLPRLPNPRSRIIHLHQLQTPKLRLRILLFLPRTSRKRIIHLHLLQKAPLCLQILQPRLQTLTSNPNRSSPQLASLLHQPKHLNRRKTRQKTRLKRRAMEKMLQGPRIANAMVISARVMGKGLSPMHKTASKFPIRSSSTNGIRSRMRQQILIDNICTTTSRTSRKLSMTITTPRGRISSGREKLGGKEVKIQIPNRLRSQKNQVTSPSYIAKMKMDKPHIGQLLRVNRPLHIRRKERRKGTKIHISPR